MTSNEPIDVPDHEAFSDPNTSLVWHDGVVYNAPIITADDGTRHVHVITEDGQDITIPWDEIAPQAAPSVEHVDAPVPAVDEAPADDVDDGVIVAPRERPQVGPWMRSRVGGAVARTAGHVVRSPWYALRGTGETLRRCLHWVVAADDADVRAAEIKAAGTVRARTELRRAHAGATVARTIVAAAPIVGAWAWINLGQWGLFPAVVVGATYVAMHVTGYRALRSRPEAQAAARHVTASGKRPALSRPFVTEALALAGFGPVTMPTGGTQGPVIVSATPVKGGERMVIDLPPGVPVSRLLKKHEELAGALGRPAECVVIEPRPEVSPLRFDLFIAHKLLADRDAVRWPWAKVRSRSFFEPIPMGVDAQGNTVTTTLPGVHGLIGGASGMGKSYTARLLLMAAACDPTAILLVHNLKGGGDYRGFAPVAHTLRAGSSRADLAALADDLAWLQGEISRRGKILERLPASVAPEGKITPQIAREHDMRPILLVVDEAQRAFTGPAGDTIAERLDDVVRTARAVGIVVRLITQGTKEGAIPSGILDQLVHRTGHGVTNIADANLILGSDAHGRGYRAVDIDTPGVAYVGTAGGRMVRTLMAKVDLPDVERIVTGAAELRRTAGTLTGMAAGAVEPDDDDGTTRAFLADVLSVWPTGDDGAPQVNAWSSVLADALTAAMPDTYEDMYVNGPWVSRRLADAGVKVTSQRVGEQSARGARHAHVVAAHAKA
jgi:DNA segregation ATPase FtsK/SpoIIIE, S-DNA-T family